MLRRLLGLAVLPLSVTLELLVLGVILRLLRRPRGARAATVAAVAVLWVASTPVVASALLRGLERGSAACPAEQAPTADAIVILGGVLGEARSPRADVDLVDSTDRIWHAAKLWKAKKAPLVIVTGSRDADLGLRPESSDVKDLLVAWGVAPDAIVEDPNATDTHGNALGAKAILEARSLRRALLVTSALHMPRALATFRRAGVDVVACPTDFLDVDAERDVFAYLPSVAALGQTSAVVHEYVGQLWYRMRDWM